MMDINEYKNRLSRYAGDLNNMLLDTANYIMAHAFVNVAIFLPNRYAGDWTLGLFCAVRPEFITPDIRFELFEVGSQIGPIVAQGERVVCGNNEEISRQIDHDVHWMSDFNMLLAPAVSDEEPLCVIMLFVSKRTKFSEATQKFMGEVANALGDEIAKMAREARELGRQEDDEDGEMESGVQA